MIFSDTPKANSRKFLEKEIPFYASKKRAKTDTAIDTITITENRNSFHFSFCLELNFCPLFSVPTYSQYEYFHWTRNVIYSNSRSLVECVLCRLFSFLTNVKVFEVILEIATDKVLLPKDNAHKNNIGNRK